MKEEKNIKKGKKSRQSGRDFELRVRKDLESKGWIVDKWTNNVEFEKKIKEFSICKGSHPHTEIEVDRKKTGYHMEPGYIIEGKLVQAKPKFLFINGGMRMVGNSSGFPDFIVFKKMTKPEEDAPGYYDVIGVESKMTGELDREEKEKCRWLLDHHVFSKILIVEKTKVKNKVVIVYHDFKEKYWRFYKNVQM